METQLKCFSEEHKEIDAICFCPECKIYMCNKCVNIHSSLFKKHHPYNINKEEEIFTGFCQEKNHTDKLKYYCKIHNKLCCAACLCKVDKLGDGQHKDCEVCIIQNIKDEKRNKLKENIKILEELNINLNEIMEKIKKFFQKLEKDKEDSKLKVQSIFTIIRNALNEREEELLSEIDNIYNNKYFNGIIIKTIEKLPKQIIHNIEKGKLIDKDWDENNIYSNINDCINIENNIKIINIFKENVNQLKASNESNIIFTPNQNNLNNFLEIIKSFGELNEYNNYHFRRYPNKKIYEKFIITGEKRNIMTKIGNDETIGTICEYELDKSIEEHKWKIKILKSKDKSINVGVAPSDFDFDSDHNFDSHGWYLYCRTLSLYSGPPFN